MCESRAFNASKKFGFASCFGFQAIDSRLGEDTFVAEFVFSARFAQSSQIKAASRFKPSLIANNVTSRGVGAPFVCERIWQFVYLYVPERLDESKCS